PAVSTSPSPYPRNPRNEFRIYNGIAQGLFSRETPIAMNHILFCRTMKYAKEKAKEEEKNH
ncbi:MAG TPA: hypothetical protein VI431_00925, partial [Candidatus Acidoferrum sp.]